MIPQIFTIGPFPINSFGLMVAMAVFAAVYRLSSSFKANGIDPKLAERYTVTAALVGLLGARLWYIGERWGEARGDLFGAFFSTAGFTFYGGFIIATGVLMLMAIKDRLSIARLADSVGPALTLGYAIGRLGCQLSGDGDYGMTVNNFLGMSYELGVVPTAPGELALPTPLYESAVCMGILYLLTVIERRPSWQPPFRRFGAYLALTGLERFLVEFLRINPPVLMGLSEAQVIAAVLMPLGAWLVLRKGGVATI